MVTSITALCTRICALRVVLCFFACSGVSGATADRRLTLERPVETNWSREYFTAVPELYHTKCKPEHVRSLAF